MESEKTRVCQYYQKGKCNYGDKCKNKHEKEGNKMM